MIKLIQPGDEYAVEHQALWVAQQEFRRVLDVGGGEKPLRAATHVIDLLLYERRRVDEGRGHLPERFDALTWLVWDVNLTPWSFWPDNHFDYVWCCQVVEDIRDPIAVCREMMRVGKAGFISTVHRSYESCARQQDGVIGYHHHRWLVEIERDDLVTFTFKSPLLQLKPHLRPRKSCQWLLHWTWEGEFDVVERFTGGDRGQYSNLEAYLERQ